MESQAENRAKENWERHNMRNRRRKGKKNGNLSEMEKVR